MVVLDATTLLLFLQPKTPGPKDAAGKPVKDAAGRVERLITELENTGTRVAIPTPVLSEVLIKMGAVESQGVVAELNRRSVFSVEAFDQLAAIEVAAMLRAEIGDKKVKDGPDTWAKVKYDRQIVAIAKVRGASAIYSDDDGIHTLAERINIPAYRVRDLPLPPQNEQLDALNGLKEKEPKE